MSLSGKAGTVTAGLSCLAATPPRTAQAFNPFYFSEIGK
jgi:hypothetical protein